jgi:hypothetical protein
LGKPKKYTSYDKPSPPLSFPEPIGIKFGCEKRPMTPQMITIIVRITITRFSANNPDYLAYMIGKLSTKTPSINQYRTNLRAYLEYKDAQTRIKEHELAIYRKAAANKKKRSKKTVSNSCVDPET